MSHSTASTTLQRPDDRKKKTKKSRDKTNTAARKDREKQRQKERVCHSKRVNNKKKVEGGWRIKGELECWWPEFEIWWTTELVAGRSWQPYGAHFSPSSYHQASPRRRTYPHPAATPLLLLFHLLFHLLHLTHLIAHGLWLDLTAAYHILPQILSQILSQFLSQILLFYCSRKFRVWWLIIEILVSCCCAVHSEMISTDYFWERCWDSRWDSLTEFLSQVIAVESYARFFWRSACK